MILGRFSAAQKNVPFVLAVKNFLRQAPKLWLFGTIGAGFPISRPPLGPKHKYKIFAFFLLAAT